MDDYGNKMKIIDFSQEHIEQAQALALAAYEEEKQQVSALPAIQAVPDLKELTENRLGVAAVEGNKIIGFLCCVSPFKNAFGSTDVSGVFSPMGANAAVKRNRAGIYSAMYQAAGDKWVKAGALSHSICLYAHDEELQRQFYLYSFGLRCVDSIAYMEGFNCRAFPDDEFLRLKSDEFKLVYPLEFELNRHFTKSPCFMNRRMRTAEEFDRALTDKESRYFGVKKDGRLCAYLKISGSGETFISFNKDYLHIDGAYCLKEYRGSGLYESLLNFAINSLRAEGYTRLGVDYESINPGAYRFWGKHFTAYTHGVTRRIDEGILNKRSALYL